MALSEWLEDRVADIRAQMTPDDEASLWTLFFSDPAGEPAVTSVIDGAMNEMDTDMLRRYVEVTAAVGATAVLVAVIRRDGQPRREDRRLFRDLRGLLRDGNTQLLGFVVVGLVVRSDQHPPDVSEPPGAPQANEKISRGATQRVIRIRRGR